MDRRLLYGGLAALGLFAALCLAEDKTRRVALQGHDNLRDLGGLKAADGRAIKAGVVYRAGALDALTKDDVKLLEGKGIKTVIDLRTDYEVKKAPNRALKGVKYVRLPVLKDADVKKYFDAFDKGDLSSLKLDKPREAKAYPFATDYAGQYAKLLAIVADPANHPVVFHCTAGKDRTGVAAALLLWALGASTETVVEDYLQTNESTKASRAKRLADIKKKIAKAKGVAEDEVDAKALEGLFQARKETLLATEKAVKAAGGSIDGFLRDKLKLSDADKKKLREALLNAKE